MDFVATAQEHSQMSCSTHSIPRPCGMNMEFTMTFWYLKLQLLLIMLLSDSEPALHP